MILSSSSRYKDTPLIILDGREQFGLFVPPEEFINPEKVRYDVLDEAEYPDLDILAVRNYGPGSEHLWWTFMYMSGAVDMDRDVEPGMQQMYVDPDTLNLFRARAPKE